MLNNYIMENNRNLVINKNSLGMDLISTIRKNNFSNTQKILLKKPNFMVQDMY